MHPGPAVKCLLGGLEAEIMDDFDSDGKGGLERSSTAGPGNPLSPGGLTCGNEALSRPRRPRSRACRRQGRLSVL